MKENMKLMVTFFSATHLTMKVFNLTGTVSISIKWNLIQSKACSESKYFKRQPLCYKIGLNTARLGHLTHETSAHVE